MNTACLSAFKTTGAIRWGLVLGAVLLTLGAPSTAADSLWKGASARSMCADKKAGAVGDLLTVVVAEVNSASKDKNTKTSKSSGIDASIASFLYGGLLAKAGKMPAVKMSATSDFSGSGAINNSEQISAQFAVRVIDVLPNRNLVIEGSRETAFSGEQQTIILRGVVRPDDIGAGNSVMSQNIADATIRFVGKGALTDAERKGWLHRVWDKVAPF